MAANLYAPAAADAGDTGDGGEWAEPSTSHGSAKSEITGTYRSHDPWTTTFRVTLRGDVPWLCFWSAPDGYDDEQPLIPLDGEWSYRVGDDPLGPERLTFDTVIDGHTARAWLSGWDYYRTGDG